MKQTRERWSGETTNVNFRLPRSTKDDFYLACDAEGVTASTVLRSMMEEYTRQAGIKNHGSSASRFGSND